MKDYQVTIKKQGNVVQVVRGIVARTAADAIAQVEALMKIRPPRASVDKLTGGLTVTGWSGYEFVARSAR